MVLGLAIGASLALGVADYLAGVALRRDGRTNAALTYTTLAFGVGFLLVAAAIPFAAIEEFSAADVGWSVAAGAAFGLALPLLMIGMARGPIAVVAPLLGLTSLAVPAIVGPLLGDALSTLELVGLLVTFPAAAMIALDPHPAENALPTGRAIVLAVTAGGLLGSAAVFFGRTSTDSGIGPGVVAQLAGFLLLLGVGFLTGRMIRPKADAAKAAVLVGLLSGFSVVLSVLAYQRGPVAIVAAVIGLAPGATVGLAWLLMKERITVAQLGGFALGVAAVILFAVG